jgi:hypothetical protein
MKAKSRGKKISNIILIFYFQTPTKEAMLIDAIGGKNDENFHFLHKFTVSSNE